jgi:two-component system OmpR family sensor kinase
MTSIAYRLIVGITLIIVILWLSAAMIARGVFTEEIDELLSDSLQGAAERILPLAAHTLDESFKTRSSGNFEELDDLSLLLGHSADYLAFELRDKDGKPLLRSKGAGPLMEETRERAGFYETEDAFFYTRTDPASHLSITIATSTVHRDEAVSETTWALVWPMLALLAVMGAATLVLVRSLLAPIGSLRIQIAERGGGNLSDLESEALPKELRPIAVSVNRLMHRLQKAMDAERAFAANSAHELRTPVAGALAQAQQLRAEIGNGKGHGRVAEIEMALRRLADLTAKLLQLSRADAGLGQLHERQNLTPVLQAVVSDFTRRATEPLTVNIDDRLHQDLMVQMDPDAFGIALRNLIENAARHGAADSPIDIVIGDDWTIAVANRGPVVPADALVELKKRFRRGSPDAEGSGLGLAIADKLVAQSGGTLTLMSPARNREDGFEAVMTLP